MHHAAMLEIYLKPSTPGGMLFGHHTPVRGLADFMWTPYWGQCLHCLNDTTWIDMGFEAYLCPGRCSEAKWDEYAWAETFAKMREYFT